MIKQNLFETWMKRNRIHEYWATHGKTEYGVQVKVLELPNNWIGWIIGPDTSPKREDYETSSDYEEALFFYPAYSATLEYYWIIPYFVWSAKNLHGNNLEELESQCLAIANNKNIYDPDRSRVDGEWVDRENLYAARVRYKEKLDAQFEAEKKAYFSTQDKM